MPSVMGAIAKDWIAPEIHISKMKDHREPYV